MTKSNFEIAFEARVDSVDVMEVYVNTPLHHVFDFPLEMV